MASRVVLQRTAAMRPAASSWAMSRHSMVQRGIASTAVLRHKEDSIHHNLDHTENQEKHKQDLLKKQKEGKGHWKPELASNSEEAVKADRTEHTSIKDLQDRTKSTAEETSKAGTSMHDGL